ncbi:MAG: heme NO-binding domain-containing protein [Candidatus Heimdallarchaeota archaeon]|nr:heme NO-binding domain-containing protein [Candidatus Heimdallarchaeota archaeon]MDH5645300.1 heme NO-binding domain-containing protein [Candidatus Heimdallarchaeota archaeon]
MHGIIFILLQKYVTSNYDSKTWNQLKTTSGLNNAIFSSLQTYDDEELIKLVVRASEMTNTAIPLILEDFGKFISNDLIRMYPMLIRSTWKTLDLIENTEQTIHTVVRAQNPGATPPELSVERLSEKELKLTYVSTRKLCKVAFGIAQGIAKHFGEKLLIAEDVCLHKGNDRCEIIMTLI